MDDGAAGLDADPIIEAQESTAEEEKRLPKAVRRSLAGSALLPIVVTLGAPGYRGPKSDHFDGERFFNAARMNKGFADFLKWKTNGQAERWPDWVDGEPRTVPASSGLAVTYINHATILVQIDGVRILTDPIFSERASPVGFAGPRRHRPPGVRFEDLPKIDVVAVSHNHYDHLDIPSLRRLAERDRPLILSGLGNKRLFDLERLPNTRDMDWEDSLIHKDVIIRYVRCQHWSARGVADRRKTLWGSFIFEGAAGSAYFAGDTGYSPHFKDQGERYGPFDIALLPIGAYEPRWFMKFAHMNPADAVQAHEDLRARQSMGIHFGTFQLTDEGIDKPAEHLAAARKTAGLGAADFWVPGFGETRIIRE